jgi:TolB protein
MRDAHRQRLAAFLAVTLSIAACDDPVEPAAPGSIEIVVVTSGQDIVTDDLQVTVGTALVRPLDAAELNATITGLAPGVYTVTLEGTSVNCQITNTNPRSVTVESNRITVVTFTIACTARVGSVHVTTSTTGSDLDADGYTAVVIDGPSQSVGSNATATISNVSEGQRLITLDGVASNCTVDGADTVAVTVSYGGIADAAFSLTCVGFGTLEVTTTMSGDDLDPNGYSVTASGAISQTVPAAGSEVVTIRLPAGDYTVTLSDIALNCDAAPAAPTVTVPSGGTTAVGVDVSCATATVLAFVSIDPYCYYYYYCDSFYDVYTIKSNGTALTRLTTAYGYDAAPAWSADGTQIAFSSPRTGSAAVYAMSADGSNQRPLSTGLSGTPSWSPDGQRIAFTGFDANFDIYVMDADGANVVRLTTDPGVDADPAWSPAGTQIAFSSTRDGNKEIYVMNADGSGVTRLTNNTVDDFHPAWSPDGARIAFMRGQGGCFTGACLPSFSLDDDLYVMNADGSNSTLLLASDEQIGISYPSWSPDGRWIAFQSVACSYANSGYCYYWTPSIKAVTTDGARVENITSSFGSDPAWRP